MNRNFHLVFVSVYLFLGCGKDPSISATQNIYGNDNRQIVTNSVAPWTSIGLLDSGCTGTLIAPSLVLTAAHCTVDEGTGSIKSTLTWFRPSHRKSGETDKYWIDYVWLGTKTPKENRLQDWALLKLATPAADKYGWVSIGTRDFNTLPVTVSMAGYSADLEGDAGVHIDCYVHENKEGRLLNDCDFKSGASGGPLLQVINQRPTIVGIAVSEYRRGNSSSVTRDAYSREYSNVAISAETFKPVVDKIIGGMTLGTPIQDLEGVFEGPNPNQQNADPIDRLPRPIIDDDQQTPRPNPDDGDRPHNGDRPQPTPAPSLRVVGPGQLFAMSNQVFHTSAQLAIDAQWVAIRGEQYRDAYIMSSAASVKSYADAMANFASAVAAGLQRGTAAQMRASELIYGLKFFSDQLQIRIQRNPRVRDFSTLKHFRNVNAYVHYLYSRIVIQ